VYWGKGLVSITQVQPVVLGSGLSPGPGKFLVECAGIFLPGFFLEIFFGPEKFLKLLAMFEIFENLLPDFFTRIFF